MSDAYKIFRQLQEKQKQGQHYRNYEKEDLIGELINLQQENQQLKENNLSMQEEMVRTWEKADLYKEVVEEVREYIKNTYDDVATTFTEDKPMTNFKARKELLEILDKAKGENNGR